ncbi:MAG: SAM-dependent DNA methyltransferase [Deferribacterales bacterium]
MTKQVKSKQRVADHGEVFTSEREVNAMLDLVKQETERIDSRFLEPACGNGNFLAEILRRKLAVVRQRYGKNASDYEKFAVVAVTSLYGIDLLPDNIEECCERLFSIFDIEYTAVCKGTASDECREAVKYILKHNIICGDALTLKALDGSPITFSEWSLVSGSLMQRRDFYLNQMLEGHEGNIEVFLNDWEYDEETKTYIPKPIKEYPLTDYRKVQQYDK